MASGGYCPAPVGRDLKGHTGKLLIENGLPKMVLEEKVNALYPTAPPDPWRLSAWHTKSAPLNPKNT